MFPFSAIVGQENAKLALLLVAVDPGIGGVLLSGVKGTGKTTIVRALATVLPELEVVVGCRFNCDPNGTGSVCDSCRARLESGEKPSPVRKAARIVTLPLGTSEDRLLGTVDIEKLLKEGTVNFEPGLLAEANRQVLYVDEVNLLPDNLTDDVLDVAVSGINTVERESISVAHPAQFILVGTMNPEEGQLRPQILDRFALSVKIETIKSPALRAEIVRRTLAFAASPAEFADTFAAADEALKERILAARSKRVGVKLPSWAIEGVAGAMASLGVDGQRPDIVTIRGAVAYAALEGDEAVEERHIEKVTPLAVSHRTRNGGLDAPPESEEVLKALRESLDAARRATSEASAQPLSGVVDQALATDRDPAAEVSEQLKKND